ncbi:MAG: PhoH family protein, partial [Sandaracinaceae bacterium]|nr:PhoH family protein [Sandaracinaceae bacterium]
DLNELGRSARGVSRVLDELRMTKGNLARGVDLPSGGHLRVAISDRTLPHGAAVTSHEVDSRILAVALEVQEHDPEHPTVLVSKDVNLRIRADALGLSAADYEHDRTQLDELYTGHNERTVESEVIDRLYREGGVAILPDLEPNQFVSFADASNPSHTGLGRVDPSGARIEPLPRQKERVWGITARNREQVCALNLLLDDRIKLVTLIGKAGTGKTLIALAAALRKTHEEKVYQRVLVSRPILPLGRDIGYLPGSVEEKLQPWMQPIFDNLELLMGLTAEDRRQGRSYQEMLHLGMLEIEPLTYIRGRSIPHQYMIVDEAQNLTVHEVKTIVSRAGEGTKIVLTGDPYQIDNPYMDANSNGLVHTVNRFRGKSIAGHVTLVKGERSELAELAANVL